MQKQIDDFVKNHLNKKTMFEFAKNQAILLVLLALVLFIGISKPNFANWANVRIILMTGSIAIVIALGAGSVLMTGGVDLSAGRVVGLASVVAASLMQRPDYANRIFPNMPQLAPVVAIAVAVLVGLIIGIINGSAIAFLKIPPFIATLGSMIVVYGLASLYIDRPPLGAQPIGGLRDDFTSMATGALGGSQGFPYLVFIVLITAFIVWVLLNKTAFGKNIYAIGGNVEAAIVSGVNVPLNLIKVYAMAGALYGFAGALLAARTGGATNNYGSGYELDAIAACVIGGVSTTGGVGKVGGIIIGVLIFAVLNNGLIVLGINPYWQQIIKGLIIVAAVSIDIRKYLSKR